MIAAHDREKFEVTCYSLIDNNDPYKNLYQKFAENFEVVEGMTYEEIAKKIHDDKIGDVYKRQQLDTAKVTAYQFSRTSQRQFKLLA